MRNGKASVLLKCKEKLEKKKNGKPATIFNFGLCKRNPKQKPVSNEVGRANERHLLVLMTRSETREEGFRSREIDKF